MADEEAILKRILHLRQVEKLSLRQIAKEIGINRNKLSRILIKNEGIKALPKPSIFDPFKPLIIQWYKEKPYLKANQVYEWLKSYDFKGSYPTIARYTRKYRIKPKISYQTLSFLPGQEAQVDWFFFNSPTIGKVAGFLYVLAYSRYAWGQFYPKSTFEFFLDGHIKCFEHIGGLAHSHRYDNLKSVVLKCQPNVIYNSQFLDFARHYGFSIYLCNPGKGNEKGRVERIIRDIRNFLYAEDFKDIADLNNKFRLWLKERNNRIHRSINKTPKELLIEERLLKSPINTYPAKRIIPGIITSKTGLVDFETNKYSVPSAWANKSGEIVAYPQKIEIWIANNKAAVHKRCFTKKQLIQNPLHVERLLNRTSPRFKIQRIYELIYSMDKIFAFFLDHHDDEPQRQKSAYCLFKLLKSHSKQMLLFAVRELNNMKTFKIKALKSLLNLPQTKETPQIWPQKSELLDLEYEQRRLEDYDGLA